MDATCLQESNKPFLRFVMKHLGGVLFEARIIHHFLTSHFLFVSEIKCMRNRVIH
jgi:hypothetical protein